jgi:hypothetical protein
MSFAMDVRLDRVGAVYQKGETVTGVVVVQASAATKHSGIDLVAEGAVTMNRPSRAQSVFEALHATIPPLITMKHELIVAPAGTLPAGDTMIPFQFELAASKPATSALCETYQGVYVSSTYTINASAKFKFSTTQAKAVVFNVSCPGQAEPTEAQMLADEGVTVTLDTETVRASKKFFGNSVPAFEMHGHIDHAYNDIDVPLSGFICVDKCDVPITSVEIQLLRAEYGATSATHGKALTEVQNIQIGDGDVLRQLNIPIHMMFPKWYTCAALQTAHMKVEFEINVVVSLSGANQITQSIPIKLYRRSE